MSATHQLHFLQVTRSNLETTQGWNGCHPGSKPSSKKDSIINLPTFKISVWKPTIQPSNQPFINQPTYNKVPVRVRPVHTHLDPTTHVGEGPSWPIGSPCNNLSRLLGPRMAPTPLSSSQYPGRVPPSPSQWRCLWCLWWWRWGVRVWLEFFKLQSQRCWYGLRYELQEMHLICLRWHCPRQFLFFSLKVVISRLVRHIFVSTEVPPQKNETNSSAQQRVLSNWWIQSWSHSLSWWDQKSRTWQMQQTSNLPHLSKPLVLRRVVYNISH